jgi:hypothetical protein
MECWRTFRYQNTLPTDCKTVPGPAKMYSYLAVADGGLKALRRSGMGTLLWLRSSRTATLEVELRVQYSAYVYL